MMEPSSSHGGGVMPIGSSRRGTDGRPQTSNNKRKLSSVSMTCNRCGKPLTTTVYRVECDCVFCEDCTYSHFEKHSDCPVCRKTLGEDGFMELVVADPSNATQPTETLKNSFQFLFTKSSSNAQQLSQQQVCARLLRSMDEQRCMMRFVLKQLVYDSTNHGNHSSEITRQFRKMHQEHTQLKQSASSNRIQAERTIADLQKKLQASAALSKEKDNLIMQLKNQNTQLKELVAADGMSRNPSSSHSQNSGGGGRRGPRSAHSVVSRGPHHHHRQQAARPPLRDIIVQQQQDRGAYLTSSRPVTGGTESVIAPTPILPPPSQHNQNHRPSSTGSASSFGGVGGPSSNSTFRDYSTGAGFVFSRHGGSGGNIPIHQSNKPRSHSQPPSPTQAFAFNMGTSHGNGRNKSQRNSMYNRGGGGGSYGRR